VPGPSGRPGSEKSERRYTFENINFIRRIKSTTNNKEENKRKEKKGKHHNEKKRDHHG
jgi:hypothetical protein